MGMQGQTGKGIQLSIDGQTLLCSTDVSAEKIYMVVKKVSHYKLIIKLY